MGNIRNDVTGENGDSIWGSWPANPAKLHMGRRRWTVSFQMSKPLLWVCRVLLVQIYAHGCRFVSLTEEDNPDALRERKRLKADAVPSLFFWSKA